MSYPLHETSLVLWRRLRDIAPAGLNMAQLLDLIGSSRTKAGLECSLQHMRRQGYLRFEGRPHSGAWHVGSVAPKGEQLLVDGNLQPPADAPECRRSPPPRSKSCRAPQALPANAPRSVWDLAAGAEQCA